MISFLNLQISRRDLARIIIGIDIIFALLSSVIVALSLSNLQMHTTVVSLWFLCAMLLYLAIPSPKTPFLLQSILKSVLVPLATFVLVILISAIVRQYYSLTFFGLSSLLWMCLTIVFRLWFRRAIPPLRVALLPEDQQETKIQHPQLEYVQLHHPQELDWNSFDALVVNPNHMYHQDWRTMLTHAQVVGVPIYHSYELSEEINGKVSVEMLQRSWLQGSFYFNRRYLKFKRFLDILAIIILLPILLPLMAVVALLVWSDVGRPILFWQERVGLDNKSFRLVKFRTMRKDSEAQGAQFAQVSDQRVSKLGFWLRKFRLDELPQFWNVLRGEMSIIGPRPEQRVFVEQFTREIPLYQLRHWVRPGISGWAQVRQGYAAGTEETTEKLRFDVYYIKHFGFFIDFKIVIQTIITILTGFGAR